MHIEQPDPQSLTRRILFLGKVLFSWPCMPAWAHISQLIYHGSQYGTAAVMGSGQHMNASVCMAWAVWAGLALCRNSKGRSYR